MKNPWKKTPATLIIACVITLCIAIPAIFQDAACAEDETTYPPPAGKVWIHSGAKWAMVPAPPNEGPYRWTGNGWERIENIPPGKKWVSPHWGDDKWIIGHWQHMKPENETQQWVSGHWAKNGHWIEGNWETARRTTSGSIENTWIPGIHSRPRPPGRPKPIPRRR